MRVLVVGPGSIGRRHLENLRALGCERAACRRDGAETAETVGRLGVPVFASLEEAEAWAPDAVVVATPTSGHVAAARWAVERGCHVLVEKPLSHTLNEVDELLAAAASAGVCLAVGYNLRFHPGLEAVKAAVDGGRIGRLFYVRAEAGQYLPDWHPEEDYRQGYAARAELGGGALLTLSHELDAVLWIAGDAVSSRAARARLSALELDVEDSAEVVCVHPGGAVSCVHVDFLDRSYNRRSRWVGEEATVEWTWTGGTVLMLGERRETLWHDPAYDHGETYLAELEDFLRCAETGELPRASGADGRRVLEVAAVAGDTL